jgi:hypothetical protein
VVNRFRQNNAWRGKNMRFGWISCLTCLCCLLLESTRLHSQDSRLSFSDPTPQRYELSPRASEIDPRAKEHGEIDFVFSKQGRPSDLERATVDAAVKDSSGQFVHEAVWRYLFTHPVESIGEPVPRDADCQVRRRQ